MSGKGSRRRPENAKAIAANWRMAFRKKRASNGKSRGGPK